MLKREVAKLKERYPQLFYVGLETEGVLIRPLTRLEYETAMNGNETEDMKWEYICNQTIVWPEFTTIDAIPPGWIKDIGEKVIELSGFKEPYRIIELYKEFKEGMSNFERQAEVIIRSAFSDITFEEMRKWNIYKFMDHLARAEWSLKEVLGLELELEIKDKEEIDELVQQEEELRVEKLRAQGIDPMLVLPLPEDKEYVPKPLTSSLDWNGDEVIDAFRETRVERGE